jgi:hypothetical protein
MYTSPMARRIKKNRTRAQRRQEQRRIAKTQPKQRPFDKLILVGVFLSSIFLLLTAFLAFTSMNAALSVALAGFIVTGLTFIVRELLKIEFDKILFSRHRKQIFTGGLILAFVTSLVLAFVAVQERTVTPQSANVAIYSDALKAFEWAEGQSEVVGYGFDAVLENNTGEILRLSDFTYRLAGTKYPLSYTFLNSECHSSPPVELKPGEMKYLSLFASTLPMSAVGQAKSNYIEPSVTAEDLQGRTWNLAIHDDGVNPKADEFMGAYQAILDACGQWPA